MKKTPKMKIAVCLMLILFALGTCLLLGGIAFLPPYLEQDVIPRLAREAGIAAYSVNVRRVGLFGADLSELRIGSPNRPVLIIESIRLDYSPFDLYRGVLHSLKISGVSIHSQWEAGRFQLDDLQLIPLPARARPDAGAKKPGRNEIGTPTVGMVEVRNATLVCLIDGNDLRIPFEIDGRLRDDGESGGVFVDMRLYPRDTEITTRWKIMPTGGAGHLEFQADHLILERFADLMRFLPDMVFAGDGSISGSVDFELAPFRITSAHTTCRLLRNEIRYKTLRFGKIDGRGQPSTPPEVSVVSVDGRNWQVAVNAMTAVSPIPMDLHHLTLTLNRSDTTLTGRGEYLVEIPATPDNPPPPVQVLFSKPLTIAGRIDIDAETENHWRLKTAASAEKQGIFCRLFTSRVAAKLPRIQIDLAATPDDIDVDFDLLLSDVSVSSPSFDIRSPRLSLKGSTRRPVTADGALSSDFNLTVRETTLTSPSAVADVAVSELQGRWRHGGKAPPTFDGEIGFSGATIRVPALKLIVPDALGRLPLQWPPKKSARPGRFRAPTIEFVGRNIGELTTELMQTTAGITFRGSHASRVIPTVSLDFEGRADLVPQTPVHFSMRYRFKRPAEGSPIDLGALHPGAGGILLSGGISGGGQLEYGPRGLGGTFESEIEKGTLRFPDSDAVVEGIHMALSLPDLPQLRSSGHQQMTFARASFGKVHISDASVHFQVESQRSLWLEKGHFKWCDGRVDVQDLHLAPDIDDYHLVLYCDRLNLAQVLEQFGAANAEGRGALNGRLPLSIRKGNIRFEDGFLYSTPGDGGKLRITDTDILTAGVPRDTPQYAQLALAREALKNYDYTWAKISLNTEDETLMLRMQMDGKPADLLPFQFDRELGGFARVEGEGAGARFQGIRLDVNFKLPLNQIMRHWKLIRMIQ